LILVGLAGPFADLRDFAILPQSSSQLGGTNPQKSC
jgi:hypothetical protein